MQLAVRNFRREVGPMDNVMFHATVNGEHQIVYWNGPGAKLKFVWHDQLVSIDAPCADGAYATVDDAHVATLRFFALLAAPSAS